MAKGIQSIDDAILAAVREHGSGVVSVVRYKVTHSPSMQDSIGEWHALFVDECCWGRRRTRSELVGLAKRGPLTRAALI